MCNKIRRTVIKFCFVFILLRQKNNLFISGNPAKQLHYHDHLERELVLRHFTTISSGGCYEK